MTVSYAVAFTCSVSIHSTLFATLHRAAAEVHHVLDLGPRKLPRIARAQPVVRRFDLLAVDDLLTEHAVFVADAVAEARNAERRHRIEKAGREPAEAAVAERGVRLDIGQRIHVDAETRERFLHLVVDAEREQGVRKRPADQEFHRQVVDALHVLFVLQARGLHPARDQPVAHGERRGVQPVMRMRGDGVLADAVHHAIGN